MSALEQYPEDCPFCNIATAYPSPPHSDGSLLSYIPEKLDVTKTTPSCFLVLAAPNVMAFLDILPMTLGHLLVVVRDHRPKVEDMEPEESRDIGFWLPLLAKAVKNVTGVNDYNIVQNNGMFVLLSKKPCPRRC
jgi:diadenosine tetraphosphate (Ap4A) HIT family hydrolase